jgi:hypothetical protein
MEQICYTIRVAGHLGEQWSDWFGGMEVHPVTSHEQDGATTLCGRLPDQAALLRVLNQIHALNLTLLTLERSIESRSS